MKLLYCQHCYDIFVPTQKGMKVCECGKTAGKYLNDKVTTVMTKECMVFGIDNNTWTVARDRAKHYADYNRRLDFYFSGWFPTKPGEIIKVDTVEDVGEFPMDYNGSTEGLSTFPWADETIWEGMAHGKPPVWTKRLKVELGVAGAFILALGLALII